MAKRKKKQPEPLEYVHCVRCLAALECPIDIKRMDCETWYMEFGICADCKAECLGMANPSIVAIIDGDVLKKLLNAKPNYVMIGSVLES